MKAYFLVLVTCTHYFLPVYVNFLLSLSNATYEKKIFNSCRLLIGVKMSIHSLSNEMDIDGQRNQAYEEDSCDSIDSVSDTTDTESSAAEDFNTEETKEVQFRQTEPTYNSPNQERSAQHSLY